MGRINLAKVIAGGLLAGVVINVSEGLLNGVVLASDWAEIMRGYNKPSTFSAGQIVTFNLFGFITGIFAVWLYAAIRPRFGAGPKTAVTAAIAVWFIGYLMPSLGYIAMDLFPVRLVTIAIVVGLVEIILGTLLGARVYREEATAGSAAARA